MNVNDLQHLSVMYKTLADDNRLKMLGLMARDEQRVTDLATVLEVTEATVSHHISKMRAVGFLNLRTDGNQRFYRVNPAGLDRLKRWTAEIETMPLEVHIDVTDTGWIDDLNLDDYAKKVIRDYAPEGHLKQIPTKQRKLIAVLDWISQDFEADRFYTEQEVNQVIERYHEDYARLRREMIGFGYLGRERGGGKYWVVPEAGDVE